MPDEILKEAQDRFRDSQDGSDFNRQDYEADVRFAQLADQWPANIRKTREQEGRPCLTVNKLPTFTNAVANEARQNRPSIKISPVDNGADEDTAEVIGGLVRSIGRASNEDVAFDTAIDQAVSGGMGFFQIDLDYAHADTFEMEARIKRIPNALMVHWDVSSTEADASDWEYAFVSDFHAEEQFKALYPKAAPVSFEGGDGKEDVSYWLDGDKIRVADYWQRIRKTRDLILFELQDGTRRPIREEQLPIMARAVGEALGFDVAGINDDELAALYVQHVGMTEIDRREAEYYEVKKRVISGVEVLDEQDWPGSMIPICPVWGREVILDGKRHFRSLIRDAKDPQAMVNFWRSASTELVALAPRAPWVGPKGFIPEGDEEIWATANTRSHATLEYDPTAGAAPQRTPFAGIPAGAIQEALNASDDMKAIIGIYDTQKDYPSASGRAILARERKGDTANFHFIDNLSRAIRYAGQCLVEIIPSVYSERESIRILGDDMREKVVRLTQEEGGGLVDEDGKRALYNLSVGKYDVTVSSGPSYATQREEAREFLMELMRQVPGAAEFLGDIALDHMDFPGAQEAADRLRKAMEMRGAIPPKGGAAQMPGQQQMPMGDQIRPEAAIPQQMQGGG